MTQTFVKSQIGYIQIHIQLGSSPSPLGALVGPGGALGAPGGPWGPWGGPRALGPYFPYPGVTPVTVTPVSIAVIQRMFQIMQNTY